MFTPSVEIANVVLDHYLNRPANYSTGIRRMPRGFRTLGCGISRQGVLAPDGIVYKVGNKRDNKNEIHNIESRQSSYMIKAAEVIIPQAHLFDSESRHVSVIAMEFMERMKGKRRYCFNCQIGYGKRCTAKFNGECINELYSEVARVTRISDIHSDNLLRIGESKFALIDLAF